MSTNIPFPATTLRAPPRLDEPSVTPRDSAPEATSTARQAPPEVIGLSVIIPVRNDPKNLDLCLRALEASEHPEFEVIVIDDASTDATVEVARRHGVKVLRQETRSGPATARNLGVQAARYPYIYFVDADVCVQPGTLEQVAAKFLSDPTVDAFFGSYDTSPGAPNVLSQYRNLLHHFVHQASNRRAFSFWSGCGAIKRSVFLELGGFDTSFSNASIEDIELGSRLRGAGHRVELVKAIQVKHMKRWTLWQMIRTDIQNRGIPWTLLLLRQGKIPNDLNLRHSQRLSALLAAGLLATLILGSWHYPAMLLVPVAALLGLLSIDRWTAKRPMPKWVGMTGGFGIAASVGAMVTFTALGQSLIQLWSLAALACLLGIVLLNLRFYLFLFRVKHPLFVFLVMPLHVLYYLYSSLAFLAGLLLHLGRRRRPSRSPV